VTNKPFKVVKQELEFYRKMGIPVPHIHPNERYKRRVEKKSPTNLWDRNCEKCSKGIRTTYAPERPEKVYCESCYLKEVY